MSNKLYVGNLSYETTEDELRTMFEPAGTVQSVSLPTDRLTNEKRGFGFVEMGTADEAKNAIRMFDGRTLRDRQLRVNISEPKR